MEAKCSLACEYLSEEDYMDLLWTTLSEFPGEEPLLGETEARRPQDMAGGSVSVSWTRIHFYRSQGLFSSSCKK